MTKRDPKSSHYDVGGIAVRDIIKAKLTREQYIGWLMGNTYKYALRANWKDQFQRDVEKLGFYVEWLGEAVGQDPDDGHVDQESMQWVCKTDPGDYAPTAEYAKQDKDLTRKLFASGSDKEKWVDQDYLDSLVKGEQWKDHAAWEMAKKIQEKFGGQDETK